MLYRVFYFLVLFSFSTCLWAQKDTTLQLSQKKWQEISENVDYTETFKEQKKTDLNISPASAQYFSDLKYLIYLVVFVIVVVLIIRVSKNFKGNSELREKVISIESIAEVEENIHEFNLDELLKEALMMKNYQLALRLNFLILVKLLSQKGEIAWAKEKTNWEYHSEIKDKKLADDFKEIIKSFEIFWYGEHSLTEFQYHFTEPSYKALQKHLSPNE